LTGYIPYFFSKIGGIVNGKKYTPGHLHIKLKSVRKSKVAARKLKSWQLEPHAFVSRPYRRKQYLKTCRWQNAA
jgi:hypothetical protein